MVHLLCTKGVGWHAFCLRRSPDQGTLDVVVLLLVVVGNTSTFNFLKIEKTL